MKLLRNKSPLLFLLFFVFFFFIFWCAPYTRDDYTFLSQSYSSVSHFITYVLQYGNGRFLGNLSGMYLVRFHVLSCGIRALIVTLIVVLTPYIMGYKKADAYVLSFLVYSLLDPILFGEVYLWSSAFYNYVSPVCFTLLCLCLIGKYPTLPRFRGILCLLTLLLGVCSQLFVEHSTLSNLFFSVAVTGLSFYFRKKEVYIPAFFWFLGTCIGAALMYAIPIVFYVQGNLNENYRTIYSSSILSLIISCCKNALKIGNYFTGMNSIPICLGAISAIYHTREQRSEKKQRIMLDTSIIITCILLVNAFVSTDVWGSELSIVKHVFDLGIILLQVLLWFLASVKIPSSKVRWAVSVLIVLALVSLAPLLIVSPMPKRTLYQGYCLFGAAAVFSMLELKESFAEGVCSKFKKTLIAIAFSFILVLSSTFVSIKSMVDIREQHILSELEKGSSHIICFQIPYKYTSLDSAWSFDFVFYREIPKDTQFTFIEYAEWMNDYYSAY